uniref:secretion/conjugation apparatus DotM-related subunit n=1 Tax=Acetobacter okinawensis TaxID=1076594 RepID=UPI00046EB5F0
MSRMNASGREIGPEQILFIIGGSLFMLCVAAYLLWQVGHTQIVMAVLFEQRMILHTASLFTDSYAPLLDKMARAEPAKVSAATLWQLLGITGFLTLWPVLLLFVVLGFACVTRSPRALYRAQFGLGGMKQALAQIHPIGQAWIGYSAKLREPPPPSAPLRPMDPFLQPDEWLARYASYEPGTPAHAQAAQNALAAQLGTPWTDPQALSPVEQCLFMVFTLVCARRGEEAGKLLETLSLALSGRWDKGELIAPLTIPARTVKAFRKSLSAGDWQIGRQIAQGHGWSRTVLIALLQEARQKAGVLNASLFSVIQLVDRDLWLILSALPYPMPGRPVHSVITTACTEAAGALEHWRAECRQQQPLSEPNVSATLDTLL